jgi:hypothetical protein
MESPLRNRHSHGALIPYQSKSQIGILASARWSRRPSTILPEMSCKRDLPASLRMAFGTRGMRKDVVDGQVHEDCKGKGAGGPGAEGCYQDVAALKPLCRQRAHPLR